MGFIFTKKTQFAELWSVATPLIAITAAPTDIPLPDITIANCPKTVKRATLMIRFRIAKDTSAAPNSISGGQVITASKDAGVTQIPAIDIITGLLAVATSAKEPGFTLEGSEDILAQLPVNGGTLTTTWVQALAVGANLELLDLQVGVRFHYL